MKTKLSSVMAVLVIATLVLSACGGATQAPATQAPATQVPATQAPATAAPAARYPKITIGIAADPQDLSPKDVNGGSHPYIFQNFYEYLFDMVDNDYVPVLAKGYTVIDDLHYQVQIYDYIYDSAGNHITADDVVFDTNWLIESGFAFKYDIFKEIKKIDDYTVEYTWTRPATRVGDLEFPWCRTVIFSQKAFESGNFATAPIATGPYVVKEYVSGSKVVLEANDKYWQTDKSLVNPNHTANVQEVEYDVIAEPAQHVIALESGAIDFSELVPVENLAEFKPGGQYADKYIVEQGFGSMVVIMTPNNSEGHPTADINFRMAAFYAIDNEAVATATNGVTVASKAFGTPHFSDYVKAWDDTPNYINTYDPELAKQYLAKTNYAGEEVKLVVLGVEPFKTEATVIQSFLVNVGINAKLTVAEAGPTFPALFTDPTAFDLLVAPIGGGSQIGEWNRVMNNTEFGNGMACGFVKDDTLQQLFETASNVETHTPENMTACHDYLLEKGYEYAIGSPLLNFVYTNHITKLVLRENEFFLPGASSYQ